MKKLGFSVFGLEVPDDGNWGIISPKMYIGEEEVTFQEGDIVSFYGAEDRTGGHLSFQVERPGKGIFAQNKDDSCRCFLVSIGGMIPYEDVEVIVGENRTRAIFTFASIIPILAFSTGFDLEVLETEDKLPIKLKFIKRK